MGRFALFHAERYTEQDILYDIENIINIPIILVFLVGKCCSVQEKEEGV